MPSVECECPEDGPFKVVVPQDVEDAFVNETEDATNMGVASCPDCNVERELLSIALGDAEHDAQANMLSTGTWRRG